MSRSEGGVRQQKAAIPRWEEEDRGNTDSECVAVGIVSPLEWSCWVGPESGSGPWQVVDEDDRQPSVSCDISKERRWGNSNSTRPTTTEVHTRTSLAPGARASNELN